MTRVSSRQADVFGEEAIVEEPLQAMSWTKAIALVDPRDIESCEELLEAYFSQACMFSLAAPHQKQAPALETRNGCQILAVRDVVDAKSHGERLTQTRDTRRRSA